MVCHNIHWPRMPWIYSVTDLSDGLHRSRPIIRKNDIEVVIAILVWLTIGKGTEQVYLYGWNRFTDHFTDFLQFPAVLFFHVVHRPFQIHFTTYAMENPLLLS